MFSIRRSVPIFFVIVILFSSSVVIVISYVTGRNSVNMLLGDLVSTVSQSVIDDTINFLRPAQDIGKTVRLMSNQGLISELNGNYYSSSSKEYKENRRRVGIMMEYFDSAELRRYGVTRVELRRFLMLKTRKTIQLLKLFEDFLYTYKQINLINYGNYDKDKVMLKKMLNGSLSIKYVYHYGKKGIGITCWYHTSREYYSYGEFDSKYDFTNKIRLSKKTYDPTKRPWFIGARENFDLALGDHDNIEPYWTSPYVFYSDQVTGISCSNPIVSDRGRMIGAISVSLTIYNISARYLANLNVGTNGKVFIVTEGGEVLAYTPVSTRLGDYGVRQELLRKELSALITQIPKYSEDDRSKIIGYKFVLTHIEQLKDSIYRVAFMESGISEGLKAGLKAGFFNKDNKYIFHFDYKGEPVVGVLFPFPKDAYFRWIGGIVIPEDDFLGNIKSNTYLVIGFSVLTMGVLLFLSIYIFSRVSIPLKRLSDATDKIKDFDLSVVVEVDTPLIEVKQMGIAIDGMVQGLKSFEKYVPSDLVRELVLSGEEAKLEGSNKTMSIFFSDIAQFTQISEGFMPRELVSLLGEYLDEMSKLIISNRGTVDKYIGDAIMAFWGAPNPCFDHAYLTCKAAIESQKRLSMLRYSKWRQRGTPLFESRIGINTGDVIVGNIGSEIRMNYTIIGDAVNLGSRLEALNKYYGTKIMCSESTYSLVKDRIFTRRLDRVTVKGKTEPIGIYEVLGYVNQVSDQLEEFTSKYESGINYYQKKDMKAALSLFLEANRIKSDISATMFIDRCERYIEGGLPSNWDGVYSFSTK